MLKLILIGLVVLIIILAVVISMQPAEFKVTRSLLINAPARTIFAEVNDLKRWENWSPWAKLDPNAKADFSGASAGEGAVMSWDGNHEVGKGSMTITESQSPSLIRMRLDFIKPMPGTSESIVQFQEQDGGTLVTWSMSGKNNFIAKAMSLIFDCEKIVGGYYETGLKNLKAVAEAK